MFIFPLLAISLLVIGIPTSLILLNHRKQAACIVVKAIAWFLLFYKITYYFIHIVILREGAMAIPAEMSAVLYFVFPIAILSKSKVLKEYATIGAFLAGLLQLLTVIPFAEMYLPNNPPPILIETIFMHFLLFIGGFIYLTRIERIKFKNCWKFCLGLMVQCCWSALANTTFMLGQNNMYLQESVLPFSIFGGNFLWDYLPILIVFLALSYSLSRVAMRKQNDLEKGIFN